MKNLDTKLKSDIAESAVITGLLKKGLCVLRPVGDRLPYDLVIDAGGKFLKIQVKSSWSRKGVYVVDSRRTGTNRRIMVRRRYQEEDFDFAILYIEKLEVFYIMPSKVFISYRSGMTLAGKSGENRCKSDPYFEAWDLLRKEAQRIN